MAAYDTQRTLTVNGSEYRYHAFEGLDSSHAVDRLPYCLRILLENLLRHQDKAAVSSEQIEALLSWDPKNPPRQEIAFHPARVLMQDFTGVPAVVDLAVMRDAMADLGGDPDRINPLIPTEMVIDHSVQVDVFGTASACEQNVDLEYQRNRERYIFLRWGQTAFENFKVVPPGTGIVHQVNLEYLARTVFGGNSEAGDWAYPDTLVGTDSHTTMINGLGVLGWGVGGIEAEAAMLGQPIAMLIPRVVGVRLTGVVPEGVTATDLVLRVVERLREHGVVGKFVEFYGDGLDALSLADRATLANMGPEYGATCGIFPIDAKTIEYLRFSGRSEDRIALVEAYAKAQGLYREPGTPDCDYNEHVEVDLSAIVPALAGPKRPQDRIALTDAAASFGETFATHAGLLERPATKDSRPAAMGSDSFDLADGAVVIAAITSCTNTSNPAVMLGAGLVAKKARARGLTRKPWVKTSLAPGSQVVTDYLDAAGLLTPLEELGFNVVGYGCTTCIGNSGPLAEPIVDAINDGKLVVTSVLSGNRNFEGRVSPHTRANYLASPPLVVAYALAGRMDLDISSEALGTDTDGNPVFLKDIWPSTAEVEEALKAHLSPEMFSSRYAAVFEGTEAWRALPIPEGKRYAWDAASTYVRKPNFFDGMGPEPDAPTDVRGARVLCLLGDSITTDHISPAGTIPTGSAAEAYLEEHGVQRQDFNSFGSRRGNHEIMVRGTFGNVRLRNQLVPSHEGSWSRHIPLGEPESIFEVASQYQADGVPSIVLAGKEYGTGSSRDWAAKGTWMLGVKAVIAQSYERIHRSNLIGMGVLPLEFEEGQSAQSLGLTGEECFDILGISEGLEPGCSLRVRAKGGEGDEPKDFGVHARLDTPLEMEYWRHGGILRYVLRGLL